MTVHEGSCSCGQLRVRAEGDPVRVGICHCLACQRRSGSAFTYQGRWAADAVQTEGRASEYVRVSDEGEPRSHHFCPDCGVTVWFGGPADPEVVAIPIGVFADPAFPPPAGSSWEERMHGWVAFDGIELEHIF